MGRRKPSSGSEANRTQSRVKPEKFHRCVSVSISRASLALLAYMFSTVAVMLAPSPSRLTSTSGWPGWRLPQRVDPEQHLNTESARAVVPT